MGPSTEVALIQLKHDTGASIDYVQLKRDFGHRGLQIIVKLANIHIIPDKPKYPGGAWHVEGQLVGTHLSANSERSPAPVQNEHICATALYYCDCENITTSRLAFRQMSDPEMDGISYEQEHHEWLDVVFGCNNRGPAVQQVGAVEAREGRLITFPDVLQHQVQPFSLADPTKPGHRKILALFLVDPHLRIISTANVTCQQRDWWADRLQEGRGAMSDLPVGLHDQIISEVDEFPIGMEEAKALRLELMAERMAYVADQTEAFEGNEFSLCEH